MTSHLVKRAGTLAALVAGTRRTLERVAAIDEMVRAATATNPEIRELWPQQTNPRYTVISTAASAMTMRG